MNTRSNVAPAQQAIATAQQVKIPTTSTPQSVASSGLRVAYSLPEGTSCPQCQHPWVAGAHWCSECGAGVPCPHCGANCGGGDFCEGCGHWLLEGQCKICYTPLEDDAAFCQECGCNHQGTWCERCHQHSHFDFCTSCGDPLSARAQELVQAAEQEALALQQTQIAIPETASPEIQALEEEIQALQSELQHSRVEEEDDSDDGGGGNWDDDDVDPSIFGGGGAPGSPPQTVSSKPKALSGGALQKLKQAREAQEKVLEAKEAAIRKAQEAARLQRLQAEEAARAHRVQSLLQQSRGQRFATGQDARLFYSNVQKLLQKDGARTRGWLCNYANNVHNHPNDCHCPADGGQWLLA